MLKRLIANLYKQLLKRRNLLLLTILLLSLSFPISQLSSITPVKAAPLSLPPETLYAGTDSGLRGDDRVSSTLEIGFSFTFYGNTYTQFNATTNGLIGFNGGATSTYTNASLPNSSSPNNAVYGFWDDLYSYDDTQLVLYRTIGDVGSRQLIVQWTNYGYFNSDLPMGTFQIILYEGSNNIRTQYRQLLTDPRSYGDSATIGLENSNGSVASQYSYNTVSLDNEQSILWTWNGSNNYTYNSGAAYEGVYLYKDNPPPNVPELTAPANGSAGVSTSPTFSWNAALNASTYNLTVSRYANLSSPVISQTGLTSTSYTGSGLSDGPTYYWGVEAVNAYGSTWSSIWSFTTAAGNSAPNNISLSNNTIAAGLPANTEVGTLSTTDPDIGDTFTYSFVEGGGSSDNSSFTISGSSLQTSTSLSSGEYTIRVRSTDQGGLYTEKIFTITVSSTNSAPTDIDFNFASFSENIAANSSVTSFSTTDPDAGDTFTYSLVSGTGDTDNSAFTISGSSLLINASPDYEAKSSYTFRVRSTDQGGLFTEKSFTMFVSDLQEDTTTIITSISPGSTVYGQDYTVYVSVAPASGSGEITGSVSVDDGANHCYATLSSGSGSCTLPSTSVGTVTINAAYGSGSDWHTSEDSSTHTIAKADTVLTIVSDEPDPSETHESYTVNVTLSVVSPGSGSPSSTVSIEDSTGGYSCIASIFDGTGSCDLVSFDPSSCTITATFPGDFYFNSSSDTESHTVQDTIPPTVNVYQADTQADPTNASPIVFYADFSEEVTGLEGSDVSFTGSTAPGSLSASVTGSEYYYEIIVTGMTGSGDVVVSLPANSVQDAAGNYNEASTSTDDTVTYDVTKPTVTVEQSASQSDPTNNEPIIFDVTFSESVTGFGSDDLTISGMSNTPTVQVAGSGTSYTVEISGATDGEIITASVKADAAVDLAGNTSLASTSIDNSVTYDLTQPTVTINQGASQPDPTNTSPIVFDVVFSETVTGFDEDDVTVTGTATKPNITVSGSGSTYIVEVEGMINGETVTAVIDSDAANDLAGNSSLASTSTDNSVTFDNAPASVTINQNASQPDPTNSSPILFDVVFSETVTGFDSSDVTITGMTNTPSIAVLGSGALYSVEVSGMEDGETITASIASEAAIDDAGNPSEASTSTDNSVHYDVTPPTVTINQGAAQADPTNAEPIVFDVEFSEPVFGFRSDDLTITGMANTPTIDVSGSGSTYTVEVTGVSDGETIIAEVVGNAAVDAAGNLSQESTSTDNSVLYDISPIKVVMDAGVIGNPGNIIINQNSTYLTKFTQINVEFDTDAYNPSGNTDEDDVTNPDNYYLLRPGENYVFNVSTCSQVALIGTNLEMDDVVVPVGPVTYDNNDGEGPFIASLTVNNGMRLPIDKYRLIICGSTTILDLAGNPLNDGVDVLIDFSIQELPATLPNTGFPMGAVTTIPEQPATSAYNSTGMFITLPTLGVSTQIIGVPLESNGWNTSWLGNYAGFLEGSAFPTWDGNTVITGHIWTATNQPGIFLNLDELEYGDEFQIFAWGQIYTYEVRSNRVVSDTNVSSVMRSENKDWVTLMTCDTYDPETGTFIYRRVVRAILIAID